MAKNEQEYFWSNVYAKDYIAKNYEFDRELLLDGWKKMLSKVESLDSIIECGANVGRNIRALEELHPNARKSAIEISSQAVEVLKRDHPFLDVQNCSILENPFKKGSFDLAYTMGVLIHIHPDDLLDNMTMMCDLTNRYALIGEYFNRTSTSLEYQ